MRSSPINYLLALALFGVMWFLTSILLASWMGDHAALADMPVDQFVRLFQIVLTAAALLGFALTAVWFAYGSKKEVAAKLPAARRFWNTLMVTALVVALVLVVVLVLLFNGQQLVVKDYLIFLTAVSLSTWLAFWISTLFWSPTQVMNTVAGRR